MSARFPYVSPAGSFPGGQRIVDGGYFENSGAATALEILNVVMRWKDSGLESVPEQNGAHVAGDSGPADTKVSRLLGRVRPHLILIRYVDGKKDQETEEEFSSKTSGYWFSETTSPLFTIIRTRSARGRGHYEVLKNRLGYGMSSDQPGISHDVGVIEFKANSDDGDAPLSWSPLMSKKN